MNEGMSTKDRAALLAQAINNLDSNYSLPKDGVCSCGCDLIRRYAFVLRTQNHRITGCPNCHEGFLR